MLTTLATLKTRLAITGAGDDDLLTRLSEWCQFVFEQHCSREFARSEEATVQFPADVANVIVPRYPIEVVTGLFLRDNARSAWHLQSGIDFEVEPTAGIVRLSASPGSRSQTARLSYIGGYVLPGTTAEDGQTALPVDLEAACIEQVAFWYQTRHSLRLADASNESGANKQLRTIELLPAVEMTLRPYRRMQLF